MHLTSVQQRIADFVGQNNLEAPLPYRLLDLSSELGEVCKELLKSTRYGREPFAESAAWEQEVGDLFFTLLCVANSSGVNLEAALEDALLRYEGRIQASGTPDSTA